MHSFTLLSTSFSLCDQRNAQLHPAIGNPWVNIWVYFRGWMAENRFQILAEGIPLLKHNLSLNKSMREWNTWHNYDPKKGSSDSDLGSQRLPGKVFLWCRCCCCCCCCHWTLGKGVAQILCLACSDTLPAINAQVSTECLLCAWD